MLAPALRLRPPERARIPDINRMVEDGADGGHVPGRAAPARRRNSVPRQPQCRLSRRPAGRDLAEDATHDRCCPGIGDEALFALVGPAVAVRRAAPHVVLSRLDAGPLSPLGPLGDLEPLQLGHAADHRPQDLARRRVVDVLGRRVPPDASVLRLAQHWALVVLVPGEAAQGVDQQDVEGGHPHRRAQLGQAWPLEDLRSRVDVPVDRDDLPPPLPSRRPGRRPPGLTATSCPLVRRC